MSRYNIAMGIEGEYQPGSGNRVLKNRLDITGKSEMDAAENTALITVQERYYNEGIITADTRFTAELIRKMHKDWLGDIYEWAGNYRSVDMSKGDFVFPPAIRVSGNMDLFEQEVLFVHTPCRPQPLEQVSLSLAVVHAELLLIHPFREGNGRLARWLSDMMAAQAGYPLPDYAFTGKGSRRRKSEYLQSVVRGYTQDYADLAAFFEESVLRRLESVE